MGRLLSTLGMAAFVGLSMYLSQNEQLKQGAVRCAALPLPGLRTAA